MGIWETCADYPVLGLRSDPVILVGWAPPTILVPDWWAVPTLPELDHPTSTPETEPHAALTTSPTRPRSARGNGRRGSAWANHARGARSPCSGAARSGRRARARRPRGRGRT